MITEEHDLIQVKKTKFVAMSYDIEGKYLRMETFHKNKRGYEWSDINHIPINKIPQIIRGLFSCYQRFHRRKVK